MNFSFSIKLSYKLTVLCSDPEATGHQLLNPEKPVCPESTSYERVECFTKDGRQDIIQKTECEVQAKWMVGSLKEWTDRPSKDG